MRGAKGKTKSHETGGETTDLSQRPRAKTATGESGQQERERSEDRGRGRNPKGRGTSCANEATGQRQEGEGIGNTVGRRHHRKGEERDQRILARPYDNEARKASKGVGVGGRDGGEGTGGRRRIPGSSGRLLGKKGASETPVGCAEGRGGQGRLQEWVHREQTCCRRCSPTPLPRRTASSPKSAARLGLRGRAASMLLLSCFSASLSRPASASAKALLATLRASAALRVLSLSRRT